MSITSSQTSTHEAQPMHSYCRPLRMSMPVGQTCTHSPQSTHSPLPSPASRSCAIERGREPRGSPRPVSVIQAEVQSTKIDIGLWRRSSQCADISKADTWAACQPILALYKERGNAARKAEVEPLLVAAKAKLAEIGTRPANADPQAHAIASVTELPEDTIRMAISALIVVLIEVGAIGGGIMATAPKAAPVTEPAAITDTAPATEAIGLVPQPAIDDCEQLQPKPRRRGRYQKRVAIVAYVAKFRQRHGRAPSHPELRAAFPTISTAAAQRYRVAA